MPVTVQQLEERLRTAEEDIKRAKFFAAAFGITAAALIAFVTHIYTKATDASAKLDDVAKKASTLDATLTEKVSQLQTETDAQIARLRSTLRIGTIYNQLEQSSNWDAAFDFKVVGAFVVPVDHFENIEAILPIEEKDIEDNVVHYHIRKKEADSIVGVRIVAFGF